MSFPNEPPYPYQIQQTEKPSQNTVTYETTRTFVDLQHPTPLFQAHCNSFLAENFHHKSWTIPLYTFSNSR